MLCRVDEGISLITPKIYSPQSEYCHLFIDGIMFWVHGEVN